MRIGTIISLLAPLAFAALAETVEERAACATGISSAYKTKVAHALSSSGVIPTLIPKIDPSVRVSPTYGTDRVRLGNVYTVEETALKPTIQFTAEPGFENATYSVFLMDPDLPTRKSPLTLNYLHWYFAHAKPCVDRGGDGSKLVTFYESPTPTSVTQHRYTFLVYREPVGYKPKVIKAQARPGFNINKYTRTGGLKLVGANYFLEAITNGIPSS